MILLVQQNLLYRAKTAQVGKKRRHNKNLTANELNVISILIPIIGTRKKNGFVTVTKLGTTNESCCFNQKFCCRNQTFC